MFTHPSAPKTNPRAEYRLQVSQRVEHSETLAQKFPNLNSLSASLNHFRSEGLPQIGSLKLTFNLEHAKSLLRFDCPNPDCVGGDFDLSAELEKAVAVRRKTISGEAICQGWCNKTTVGLVHCHHLLRFKLSLGYKVQRPKAERKRYEIEQS